MANFIYDITIFGDCNQSNSGYLRVGVLGGGNGPYNFNWNNPDLGIDTLAFFTERFYLSAGTYSLIVTDSAQQTDTFPLTITSGVCCALSGVTSTTCGFDNGAVTASTGSFLATKYFLYTQNDTYITSAETNQGQFVFNNLSADSYYVLSTDIGGCTGSSQSFVIEDSPPFDYQLYVVPNSSCSTGNFGKLYVTDIVGESPYTYSWSNGQTTDFIFGLSNGSYSVTVTDAVGCQLTKQATITTVDQLGIVNINATQPACFTSNGSLTFTFSGGTLPIFYSASTGLIEILYDRVFTLPNIQAGTYTVQATDAAYCRVYPTATLNTSFGMTSVNVLTQNSSCSDDDGSIDVRVVGGNLPYTYTLIGPGGAVNSETSNVTNKFYGNLSAGTYTLFVIDDSGCTFTNNYYILSSNQFSILTRSTGSTNVSNTGIIQVEKSIGGTTPFTYKLDNTNVINTSFSSVTYNNVSPGNHTVEVTDSLGCRQRATVFVETIPSVNFSLIPTNAQLFNEGTLTALISSGKPPFTFNWSSNVLGNPQSIFVGGLTGGTYSLTITDANNTSETETAVISKLTNYSTTSLYKVGEEPFQQLTSVKNAMLNLLNEGFYILTSANTECQLVSASFKTKVLQLPAGILSEDVFFTTTSLLVGPPDDLWYQSVKTLLLQIRGVYDVIIDNINNRITIVGDLNNQSIVNNLEIQISVEINYDIDCLT